MNQITKFVKIVGWMAISGIIAIILIASAAFLYLSPTLPKVERLKDIQLQIPLRILTNDGKLIGEYGEKRREPLDYKDIPPIFIKAVLAAEDDAFFSHPGVDIAGLIRASLQLAQTGAIQSGGSTITMQVAKNYFLTQERTFSRKFNEIFLALQIESELTKEEILELYLNKIFLGNRSYGAQAAAKVYYGKPINELNLAQLAMIAGLPKAPSAYNPIANPDRATIRRNWILDRMYTLQHITKDQLNEAKTAPVTASYHGSKLELDGQYASSMAHQEALAKYGDSLYSDGYIIYTTIDSQSQTAANIAVQQGLLDYDRRHGFRGAEKNLGANYKTWIKTLKNTATYGSLVPAIVSTTEKQKLTVVIDKETEIDIPWERSFKNFAPYANENFTAPNVKSTDALLKIGDLIRITQDSEGNWWLSQLPAAQAALISLDSNSGKILSVVGGFDFNQSKFNRATQAQRQPGSNIKPFLYTAAIAKGYTPASLFNDAPIVYDDKELETTWRPNNAGGRFNGPTRLRQALYQSRNLVSIRLLRDMGLNYATEFLTTFGFDKSRLPKDLSLALGTLSVTPLELVDAYTTLANGGYNTTPFIIDKITNIENKIIFQSKPLTVPLADTVENNPIEIESIDDLLSQENEDNSNNAHYAPQVIDPRVTYIINDILKDAVQRGTATKAKALKRNDLAGKTGTTNGPTDAWFSGYANNIVTTAWLGFDNNSKLGRREYGGTAALPIWINYMKVALKDKAEKTQTQPSGISMVRIDPETGLLASSTQSNAIFEIFLEEHVPTEYNEEAGNFYEPEAEGSDYSEEVF